jgi:thiol-disulfide isomerase/thioredoxin
MVKKKILNTVSAVFLVLFLCGAAAADTFPSFSSQTLDGKGITSSIFADKKLTVINIWTTWCPPCIAEMPDLGNMARNMPKGSQLVGIVLDAFGDDDIDEVVIEAKRILSRSKADFPQILPVYEMASVLETVEAIPTTIFVDSKGRIIGEPLVGSRREKDYRASIEKALKSLK